MRVKGKKPLSRIVRGQSEDIQGMRLENKQPTGRSAQGFSVPTFRSFHASNVVGIDEAEQMAKRLASEARAKAMKEAEQRLKQPLVAAVENLEGVLDELSSFRRDLFKETEAEVLGLVNLICKKILQTELKLQPEVLADLIEKSFESLEKEKKISVYVNPSDEQMFKSAKPDFLSKFEANDQIHFSGHQQIPVGTALVHTENCEVEISTDKMVDHLLGKVLQAESVAEETGDEGDKV